jgi:uncharacterized protein (TIGR02246 family)
MENAVEALERRLTAAEDRLEIIDLEAEYSRSWDSGDTHAWANLFTPDGVFEITRSGDQAHRVVRGTKELAEFCAEVGDYYQGLHFNTVPRLRIDQDVAWGQVHFQWIGIFRPGATHSGQRRAAGFYKVTYQRLEGRWRMDRRVETQISGSVAEAFDPVIAVMGRDAFGKSA